MSGSTSHRRALQTSVSCSPTVDKNKLTSVKMKKSNGLTQSNSSSENNRKKLSWTKSEPSQRRQPSATAALVASSTAASMISVGSSTSSMNLSAPNKPGVMQAKQDNNSALSLISSSAGVSRRSVSEEDVRDNVVGGVGGSCEVWQPSRNGPKILARNRSGLLKDNPYQVSQ